MKIAQICPYDMDRPGGVQAHIADLSDALRALGHEVTVFAPYMGSGEPPPIQADEQSVRLGRARKIRFGGTAYEISLALGREHQRLKQRVRDGQFDVMHFHTIWTPLLSFQIFRQAICARVATFHDTPSTDWQGRLLRPLFKTMSRYLLPRLDGVITPSAAPQAHLVGRGPKLQILPPSTNLRRFQGAQPGLAPDLSRLTILFLGRLEQRKGASLLLDAFHGLIRQGLPVRLMIAGQGEEETALRAMVEQRRLEQSVTFLGAFHQAETPGLYAACDIFCAPSPYGESFGIVLAEAMASGKPVIAAANQGYQTVLTGFGAQGLTPPGDVAALQAALAHLITHPSLRAELGAWGKDAAMQYDATSTAPQFVAVYEAALQRFSARKRI